MGTKIKVGGCLGQRRRIHRNIQFKLLKVLQNDIMSCIYMYAKAWLCSTETFKIYNNFISVLAFLHFLDIPVFIKNQSGLGLSRPLKGLSKLLASLLFCILRLVQGVNQSQRNLTVVLALVILPLFSFLVLEPLSTIQ